MPTNYKIVINQLFLFWYWVDWGWKAQWRGWVWEFSILFGYQNQKLPIFWRFLILNTDDTESYIVYHHIDDEQELKEPHFCIIWTSKKLSARIGGKLTQDDATYRLLWQGYPFYVSGRSHSCGRFFLMLASHEDTSWALFRINWHQGRFFIF